MTKPPSSAPIASVARTAPRAALLQQLLEPLELAFVVAQDERGRRAGEERAEAVEVAVDLLRREEAELEVHALVPQQQPRERREPRVPRRRAAPGCPRGWARPRPAGGPRRGGAGPRSRRARTSSRSGPEASSMRMVSDGSSSSSVRRERRPAARWRRGPSHPPGSPCVLIGRIVTSVSSCSERWVVRSNPRMDETSSPHHSSRAGAAMPKPYTSRMPPRTLNSATSVTVGTRR